jgi:hypothetical protein
MASAILARHPLATLSMDSNLAMILELENPLLMSSARLKEILQTTSPDEVEPEVRAYLTGILECHESGPCGHLNSAHMRT